MPKFCLKLLHTGNANLVFQVGNIHENHFLSDSSKNAASYWEKRLWRVCQKFERLSKNNDYTCNTNYPYLKNELQESSLLHSVKPFFLEYELASITVDDLDAHSKKLLEKYVPVFDQQQIWGFLMPNMLPSKTSAGNTVQIDHFSRLHDYSTEENGNIEMIWECKPKWGYYNQAGPEKSWFCRNCCLNFARQKSRKVGKICYSQACEFQDVSVLQKCLEEKNVEKSLHKKLLEYFTSPESVLNKIYQAQYDVLKDTSKRNDYLNNDDPFMHFFDPMLMLLRDVSCFIEFHKNGVIREYIVDIDYKQSKLDKWKEDYEELCDTVEKLNAAGNQQRMYVNHTLSSQTKRQLEHSCFPHSPI